MAVRGVLVGMVVWMALAVVRAALLRVRIGSQADRRGKSAGCRAIYLTGLHTQVHPSPRAPDQW